MWWLRHGAQCLFPLSPPHTELSAWAVPPSKPGKTGSAASKTGPAASLSPLGLLVRVSVFSSKDLG